MNTEAAAPPEYVTADAKEREQFLSQLGNFTPDEREIFHFLCHQWQPQIPYGRISSGASLDLGNRRAQLDALMEKLRVGHIGLLRTRRDGANRSRDYLVLTNEGELRFYAHLVAEESDRLAEDIPGMPPLEKLLTSRGVHVPSPHIREYSYEEVVAVDGSAPPRSIVRLPGLAEQSLLVSPFDLSSFTVNMRARVADLLGSGQIALEFAKLCGTTMSKLRAVIGSDHAPAWVGLTKSLFDVRKELESRKAFSLPKALFPAAAVCHRISVARAAVDRERVEQEKERHQDLETIASEIGSDQRLVLEQVDVNNILEGYRGKYGAAFEAFREEFYKQFVTPKERRNLATIQFVAKSYVHQDNCYRVFLDHFQDVQAELYTYYLGRMNAFVRGQGGQETEVFASTSKLSEDIGKRVAGLDKILGELFRRPFLLAEVIIYGEKKRRQAAGIADVRTILARFFLSERMDLRDFSTIFEISMVELFETAFIQLPLLLQVWLKISGRYEGQRETVVRRSGPRMGHYRDGGWTSAGSNGRVSAGGTPNSPATEGKSATRSATTKVMAATGPQVSSRSRRRTRRKKASSEAVKAHYYSKREQETAWQQFTQALKR